MIRYQDVVLNSQGRPVVNLSIAVLAQAGLGQYCNVATTPGSPLASIFFDEAGTLFIQSIGF